ncbi:TapB [Desulforapulum autotrophicum HRM2]|uniref:TapB n=1 Tax=Desulforapulum autotrophicum (strain ATCC 43914 / DSM 3382 / VKM B-1955 / HRM2) TaxID=177437 RepID=C0QHB2_DESAH|nr:GspE/PulE family protein [Desulforapulum autotrophicum]ACN17771.1 TapB [Desulforapulum autotrophicum HRM2]
MDNKDTGKQVSDQILAAFVKTGILSPVKAKTALRVKSKLSPGKTIVDVVKDLKYATSEQLKEVFRSSHLSLRIGDILVEFGYLTPERLRSALDIQKTDIKKQLGQIIIEHQFMSESDFLDALSVQLGFPYVNLSVEDLDTELLNQAPIQWCRSNHFLPVRSKEDKVIVAFADPFDKASIDSARKLYGENLIIAISSPGSIEKYLDQLIEGKTKSRPVIDENTAIGIVNTIISAAIQQGASDIHMEPMKNKLQVKFRIDGILVIYKEFPRDVMAMVTARIKVMSKANIAEKRRHQDGRMSFEDRGNTYDLRVSIYVAIFGEKIVLRVLNRIDQIIHIEDIGMQPKMLECYLRDVLSVPSGVLIITGPTGSGKTTTLYSCLNYIKKPELSIITAEDPVEYVMEGITQCSIDPNINLTYEETLRHVVRQDPDIIVIGEIRDNYSADVAVHAALTGHKVLTSFHTEDSISGLIRLMNMEIEAFLISSTVVCVLSQRLLRKVCRHCAQPYKPSSLELKLLGYAPQDIARYKFMKGTGCPACNYTGYKGRIPVFEMLVLNEYVREAILNHKSSYEIRKISIDTTNLVTLMEDAVSKAVVGITTLDEIFRCVPRLILPRPVPEINRLLGV